MISIAKHKTTRRRLPLTPLIDVIFILVMFFLLSSTFGVWRPLEFGLAGPKASDTVEPVISLVPDVAGVLISIRSGRDGAADLTVNGLPVHLDALREELDLLAGKGANAVVIVPAAEIDIQSVVRVLDRARSSRLRSVRLNLNQ